MPSGVVELLADLATALDGASVPWYLFGAQAAILHGAARLTADVDVTVQLPEAMSQEALVAALERHGFRRRIVDPVFVERTRVIPLLHAATTLPTDVVMAGPGIEELFFERVVVREIEGIRVRVASAEDIVVMKILAARPKDLDDVVAVVAAYGNALDTAYVRTMLTSLERALAQSDLLPAFEQAVSRAQGAP